MFIQRIWCCSFAPAPKSHVKVNVHIFATEMLSPRFTPQSQSPSGSKFSDVIPPPKCHKAVSKSPIFIDGNDCWEVHLLLVLFCLFRTHPLLLLTKSALWVSQSAGKSTKYLGNCWTPSSTTTIIITITIMIKIIGFETATYHNRSYYVIIFNIYISLPSIQYLPGISIRIYIYIYSITSIYHLTISALIPLLQHVSTSVSTRLETAETAETVRRVSQGTAHGWTSMCLILWQRPSGAKLGIPTACWNRAPRGEFFTCAYHSRYVHIIYMCVKLIYNEIYYIYNIYI